MLFLIIVFDLIEQYERGSTGWIVTPQMFLEELQLTRWYFVTTLIGVTFFQGIAQLGQKWMTAQIANAQKIKIKY